MSKTIHRVRIAAFAVAATMIAGAVFADGPFQFYPLTPCRIGDTRSPSGTNAGPKIGEGETRNFEVRGRCGIPTTAKAASLNVTIVNPTNAALPTAGSWLTIWASGAPMPTTAAINFNAGDPPIGNGVIAPLSTNTADLSVRNANGQVHVVIDVTGYFQ